MAIWSCTRIEGGSLAEAIRLLRTLRHANDRAGASLAADDRHTHSGTLAATRYVAIRRKPVRLNPTARGDMVLRTDLLSRRGALGLGTVAVFAVVALLRVTPDQTSSPTAATLPPLHLPLSPSGTPLIGSRARTAAAAAAAAALAMDGAAAEHVYEKTRAAAAVAATVSEATTVADSGEGIADLPNQQPPMPSHYLPTTYMTGRWCASSPCSNLRSRAYPRTSGAA